MLIVKRNHSTTLAQPLRLERKGFLESAIKDLGALGCQGLEKMTTTLIEPVDDTLKSGAEMRLRNFFTFENKLSVSKEWLQRDNKSIPKTDESGCTNTQ